MPTKNYTIREVSEADSKRIWEIRNHPACREFAHSSSVIPFEQHNKWFKDTYINSPSNKNYILLKDAYVIGYCRYDLQNDHYLISIALDPTFQKKGLGSFLLSSSLTKMRNPKYPIHAEIHKRNEQSLKLFRKHNFMPNHESNTTYYLTYLP